MWNDSLTGRRHASGGTTRKDSLSSTPSLEVRYAAAVARSGAGKPQPQ